MLILPGPGGGGCEHLLRGTACLSYLWLAGVRRAPHSCDTCVMLIVKLVMESASASGEQAKFYVNF